MGEWSDQFTQQKLYFNLGHITRQFAKSHLNPRKRVEIDSLAQHFTQLNKIIKRLTIAVDSLLMKRKETLFG